MDKQYLQNCFSHHGWLVSQFQQIGESWSFVLISGILSGWATWTGAMQGRAAACDIRIGEDGWQYFLYIQVQYFKCSSIDSIYYIQYWRLAAGKQYLSTSRPYHEWDGKIRAHLRRNLSPAFTSRRILNLTFRELGIDLSWIWEIGREGRVAR